MSLHGYATVLPSYSGMSLGATRPPITCAILSTSVISPIPRRVGSTLEIPHITTGVAIVAAFVETRTVDGQIYKKRDEDL